MKKKLKVAVLADVSRAYDRDVLTGVAHFNKIHDKFIFFSFTPKYIQYDDQAALIERVIAWKPDGIITREVEGFEKLLDLDIPLIIAPHTRLYKDKVNLWGHNYTVGKVAAEYFISKGYRNYTFLGFKNFQWSSERQAGFVERVNSAGYKVQSHNFDNRVLLWEQLSAKITEWLPLLKKPCAVFSVADELNVHVLEAAKELGFKVPDDLSVLGVDNDVLICDMASPTLSSIDHNARQAGFQAAVALSRWMEYNEKPAGDIITGGATVITRNSTSGLAIDDEQTRSALHYIANTAPSNDISVDDVVAVTTLSRRGLEKKFQQMVRSSILDEIKKVRIGRIKFLLENSDLTIQQIAADMNFNNSDNITRYFKQHVGMTPRDYRNQFR
ncbi:substrate-binding domain-containing protein [Chitinophaga sp. G-6-1-13]|uniref:Substrate-binding domain-containing protein n=1 Tax=Chitinophaga fulva TaxID=2728842 RepID=A0A848GP49_9BACT|nr:DNA-binding transcriptional regulator [Chitinophaga fulva]NML40375.1 substrate-binding domain-containing protein [Chitinophaga fulva]